MAASSGNQPHRCGRCAQVIMNQVLQQCETCKKWFCLGGRWDIMDQVPRVLRGCHDFFAEYTHLDTNASAEQVALLQFLLLLLLLMLLLLRLVWLCG